VPHRYAVLWETSSKLAKARPAGLVVEQDGFVLVEARNELGLPSRYDKPFRVTGPDMILVEYKPGDDQYFDHVILDLSRSFIVGKEGRVGEASEGVILKLLAMFVFQPLRREHPALYCDTARTFPTVAAFNHRKYYKQADEPAQDEQAPQRVGARMAVAA
jgi:hypothetical protein